MNEERFVHFKSAVDSMPFHEQIGLNLLSASDDELVAEFSMKPQLMGNRMSKLMHGGVVAATLDGLCGYLSAVAATRRLANEDPEAASARVNRISTIDLRIDYLRPLRSAGYVAKAYVVHAGSRIIRARGEVHSVEGELVATGLANYSY